MMNPLLPAVSIVIAFATIFILNRECERVDRNVGPLHSVGIAVLALLCVSTGFYLARKYSDAYSYSLGVRAFMLLVLGAVSLCAILMIFRRIIGLPSCSQGKGNETDIHIHFGGDIKDDRAFAYSIRSQLVSSAPASVSMFDIHEFERRQDDYQDANSAGTFVYVISESFVSDASIRQKLVQTTQKAVIPGYMYFFLLRGTSYQSLRATYPEMEKLGNRVMIGTEPDLRTMLDEVLACARSRPLMMRHLRRFARTKHWISFAGVLAGTFLPWLYATAPIVWLLLVLSVYTAAFEQQVPHFLLTLAVCQFVALLLHRQRALDFWPFLGSCLNWKLDSRANLNQSPWTRPVLGFWRWTKDTHARRRSDRRHDRSLHAEEFVRSLRVWSGMVLRSRAYTLAVLLGGGLPTLLFGLHSPSAVSWALLGGMLGLVLPAWVSWSQQLVKRMGYRRLCLTDEELDRTSRFFRLESLSKKFFVGNLSFLSHRMHHDWFRQKPRVFISYSWTVDEKHGLAPDLHRVLTDLRINHFYDKDSIRSSFASWRASVSDALMQCTHVLVLLDPSMPAQQVVDREIRTAVQRLHTDIIPSIICVADADTVKVLLDKKDLPFELRWLLEWAPRISPREARDPIIVESILRQRTRQGRFRNFFTLIFPGSYLRSFIIRNSIPVSSGKPTYPWKGSESYLRASLWYSHDPTQRAAIALKAKRLADRSLGGTLSTRNLLVEPSGYFSGETGALLTFEAECKALLINPSFAIAYVKRAVTASTLVDVAFYNSGAEEGFSVSGQSLAYGYEHCLVDAGLGLILSSVEERPHAEYTLGFLIGEHVALSGILHPAWLDQARTYLELSKQHARDPALAQRCTEALQRIDEREQNTNNDLLLRGRS
ncbi:MAG: TIR domain-containing protein [Proteobacteria bacterium]|nr:TIR domain-containing protein [Pseudomonadota bacterium]